MKILGIDPGTRFCGYALIEDEPLNVVESGTWKFPQKLDVYERILMLGDKVREIFETHLPEALSIEKAFVGKNPQTALKLGEARGVVLGVAFSKKIIVRQYEPAVVKQATTNSHKAKKEQVAYMMGQIFKIEEFSTDDESDALAVAYTFSTRYKAELIGGKPNGKKVEKKTKRGKNFNKHGKWKGRG